MPKFVYVKNSFGNLSCEIHYEDTTNGAGLKKEHPILQEHPVTLSEAMKGLKFLEDKYPFTGKLPTE